MLSGILNSPRAIETNIAIMRKFVALRKLMETHKDLAAKSLVPGTQYPASSIRYPVCLWVN